MSDAGSRPIVHIGYHRTATTWFQERIYPAVCNGFFVPRSLAREALIEPNAFSFSADQARQHLSSASKGQRLLICEENLSGYPHNGGLGGLLSKEIAARLKATLPEALIIVFIRSQPAMIAAAYAQYVKGGGTHSASRYVRGQRKMKGASRYWYKAPLFSLDHFEYSPLLAHYADLFGRDSIRVKLYEQFAEDPRVFIRDFADEFSLELEINDVDLRPLNVSMSRRQLSIMRRLNLLTSRSVLDKQSFLELGNWYERRWDWLRRIEALLPAGKKHASTSLLNEKLLASIKKHYSLPNARLGLEWGLPLGRYNYPMRDRS